MAKGKGASGGSKSGGKGTLSGFTKHPISDLDNISGSGIYAATKGAKPLYIGESGKMKNRVVKGHEKIAPAIKQGADAIQIKKIGGGKDARRKAEDRLIKKHKPPLNEKGNPDK